ncbi:hypothetical protein G5I_07231 [Acromyrmex echinatior]|uniref:Uncharacterized protein n=1 Tax=Acromyrmex echinatior TaxID=103372 RepID=F4WN81_ACREC|nr:hypothetical protein G5I_07231 [Acromyrmex echinatior]
MGKKSPKKEVAKPQTCGNLRNELHESASAVAIRIFLANVKTANRHTDRWLSKNELNTDENTQRNPPKIGFILDSSLPQLNQQLLPTVKRMALRRPMKRHHQGIHCDRTHIDRSSEKQVREQQSDHRVPARSNRVDTHEIARERVASLRFRLRLAATAAKARQMLVKRNGTEIYTRAERVSSLPKLGSTTTRQTRVAKSRETLGEILDLIHTIKLTAPYTRTLSCKATESDMRAHVSTMAVDEGLMGKENVGVKTETE